jgi:hypothetical protein
MTPLMSCSKRHRNRELGKFLTTYDATTLVIDPVDGAP